MSDRFCRQLAVIWASFNTVINILFKTYCGYIINFLLQFYLHAVCRWSCTFHVSIRALKMFINVCVGGGARVYLRSFIVPNYNLHRLVYSYSMFWSTLISYQFLYYCERKAQVYSFLFLLKLLVFLAHLIQNILFRWPYISNVLLQFLFYDYIHCISTFFVIPNHVQSR